MQKLFYGCISGITIVQKVEYLELRVPEKNNMFFAKL